MKLHVEVTQDDIDNGCVQNARGCMVHRAIERATEGGLGEIWVYPSGVWHEEGDTLFATFPAYVGDEISRWDYGHHVSPFAFDLDLPDSLFGVES